MDANNLADQYDLPTLDFCAQLVHETGVLLAPGSVCYESEGFLRLGVATPQLAAGLDRLGDWLDARRAGPRTASVGSTRPGDGNPTVAVQAEATR